MKGLQAAAGGGGGERAAEANWVSGPWRILQGSAPLRIAQACSRRGQQRGRRAANSRTATVRRHHLQPLALRLQQEGNQHLQAVEARLWGGNGADRVWRAA